MTIAARPQAAQAGGAPSAQHLEAHRRALTGHCYRMLGALADADDAVQETLARAVRGLGGFDGRASLRTWLLRIATNVCIDILAERRRRVRPIDSAQQRGAPFIEERRSASLRAIEDGPPGTTDGELVTRPREHWLEPVPDASIELGAEGDPARRALLRESVRLAFVAALQHLPPRQRAALLLCDVLDWSAAEVAAALDQSVTAVHSALQRARATLASRGAALEPTSAPLDDAAARLLARYVAAFERYDADALAALCREDIAFSMPPYALWLSGPAAVHAWLLGRGQGCRGSRLVPTAANGGPAFGQYRVAADGRGHRAWGLVTLELAGDRIARWTTFLVSAEQRGAPFLSADDLFPRFGLPLTLPAR